MVTIIDTPGFGDDIENEQNTIEELVDVLKNKVKFVHVFVLAFNGESPRLKTCFFPALSHSNCESGVNCFRF